MNILSGLLSINTVAGDPVTVGDVTVTPRSRLVVVRLPFAAWARNQPLDILIEQGGRTETRRIVNVMQLISAVLTVFVVIVTLASRNQRSSGEESKSHGS